MKEKLRNLFAEIIRDFRLPRYDELPNVGIYLEQVTQYINGVITPLGCQEMTSSMISNYVKKGVVSAPIKKQYYADQIAYLIFVSIGKQVISIENISKLYDMQKLVYDVPTAYNYFCDEFENMLQVISGIKDTAETIGVTQSKEKEMLRSVIIAVANIIFVNYSFEKMREEKEKS